MKFSTLLKLMRFWPPFWGAGISVKSCSSDMSVIEVQMKMRFWNKNYVGTHFGGSLYSMTDPFYMLMLMNLLGKDYIVWDKSASIRYKVPAKGTVCARFELTHEQIEKIRQEVRETNKCEPEFAVEIKNSDGSVISIVNKIIHISKKRKKE
jgi:hypothetical protein